MVEKLTPEEQLLQALRLDKLTDDEAKYLNWLIRRPIPLERQRELFKKRFPDSKWL